MSYCRNCGTALPSNGAFCPKCGKEIPQPQASSTLVENDQFLNVAFPVNRTPLSIIAGYLGLLAIIPIFGVISALVGCWALYDLKGKPNKKEHGRAWFAVIFGTITTIFWFFTLLI